MRRLRHGGCCWRSADQSKKERRSFLKKRTKKLLIPRSLLEDRGPHAQIQHVHSMAPARIPVPPLSLGAGFLDTWPINALPTRVDWRETFYDSMAPATFVLRDVIVHSSAGIISIGDAVLTESLWHTDPQAHGYEVSGGGVILSPREITHLKGTYITLLAGARRNYFHAMIEGVARIAMVQPHLLDQARSVLLTQGAVAQDFVLDHLTLPVDLERRAVSDAEALHIETLIYPWSIHGDCDYHPCITDFYRRISDGVAAPDQEMPRRLYIDRRGTALRPLVNEDAVIARLSPAGFVAIRPEDFSPADQLRLFRGAEAIVAPHGAGLTNIGYCRPGTILLELFMDAYVNWCFRRLAAVKMLRYDCLLGRSIDPWSGSTEDPHGLRWRISPDHVAGAIAYMLERAN